MASAAPVEKNPVKARAGRIGSAVRWADPARRTTLRMHALTPPQRAVVLARVKAFENMNARETQETGSAGRSAEPVESEVGHAAQAPTE